MDQLVVDGQAVVLWHQVVDGHVSVESTLHIFSPSASGSWNPAIAAGRTDRTESWFTVLAIFASTIRPVSMRDAHARLWELPRGLMAGPLVRLGVLRPMVLLRIRFYHTVAVGGPGSSATSLAGGIG
jgi:hypothetical protein